MTRHTPHALLNTLALGLALALGAAPALAEKPEHAGGGKHKEHKHKPEREGRGEREYRGERDDGPRRIVSGGDRTNVSVNIQIGSYFTAPQRRAVVDYYEPQFRAGHCPPGLAKKRNGCMPPGQAKKWRTGYPLPRDVVYYPVPADIAIRLGTPPAGHKFVRVATDILLIAVGTGLVIDAIDDLGRL
jgi:Ni/Co efflux regulator RcnB